MEKIYTIPVNEAFEKSMEEGGCPLCRLAEKLEEEQLELILGASMMEPDIRIQTNRRGFCRRHYDRMFHAKNRLGLALMLESHLTELLSDFKDPPTAALLGQRGKRAAARMKELESSCYLCEKIGFSFRRMEETVLYLYETDPDFRAKLRGTPVFCVPHARDLLHRGEKLPRRLRSDFAGEVMEIVNRSLTELLGDVSWFCKKFDYRYEAEPWGNAKDAVERAVKQLS